MTRILLIQTASAKRIREKAELILSSRLYPDPEISIACDEKDSQAFRDLPAVKIYALGEHSKRRQIKRSGLSKTRFDVAFAFWTGEKRYRRWKWLGLWLMAKEKYVLAGDGNAFRLTWKAIIRHTVFRCKHPLPSDHWNYVRRESEKRAATLRGQGERILIIQSAEPVYVIQSLDRLREKPLFVNPVYTVFCRNHPETVGKFRAHPMPSKVITHSETRGSFRHLRELRRQRFDTVVLFLTGDPGYRKIKLFAFLLGVRRMLIFNEFCDCFFFRWHRFFGLITSRLQGRPHAAVSSKWSQSTRILVSFMLKSALLPFRFFWLLLIWLRLRVAG